MIPIAEVGFAEATWILIVKSLVIFLVIFSIVPLLTVMERKLLGRFQHRYGPNRVGPFGIMQPLADAGKLISKEAFHPTGAVPALYIVAPMLSVFGAVATLAVIPFGDVKDGVGFYGIDVSIAVLFAFAFSSISFYGLLIGGWASTSKYSLLGGMRAAAQLISYEIAMAISILSVVLMAGSLSMTEIVRSQHDIWWIVPQFVAFGIFLIASFAETNRAPFDLPEADAELVAGYSTEYGGMRYGTFAMVEYLEMVIVGALASVFFLGGWMGPGPGFLDPFWMCAKIFGFLFLFMWVRATLPRLRYDQLMTLGWKVLIPLATVNAMVTAVLVTVL